MTLETLLGPAVPATYLVLLGLEALRPARAWPAIRFWRLLGGAFFVVMGGVVTVSPLLLPAAWIAEHRLLDLTGLGIAGSFVVGYLGLTFVLYWFHRAEHAFDPVWRLFHQLHHSPQRVDLSGFAFTHPTEMLATALIAATTTTLVLGIDPRPEAHGLHHERGVHYRNFADLPLWDRIFGTYANPQRFDGEAGFDQPASRRVGAMLAFADVHGGRL